MNRFNKRFLTRDLLVIGSLLTVSAVGLVTSLPAGAAEDECFAIADNDRGDNKDVLVRVFKDTEPVIVGDGYLGTTRVEATTFSCDGKTLYVVDGDKLGTVDLDTAKFTPVGSTVGMGHGAEGEITFEDIDGLAFDCVNGKLYGTDRREHKNPPEKDLLIEINPATGAVVKDAFGAGVDYLAVTVVGGGPGLDLSKQQDVDALTWEPLSKSIYLTSNEGDGINDVLAVLDMDELGVPTGTATYISDIPETDDIEGLEFSSLATIPSPTNASLPLAHELFGITGDDIAAEGGAHAHRLYAIDYPYPGENGEVAANQSGGELDIGPQVTDLEALACRSRPATGTCKLYAVHDQNLQDTQLITIDPYAQGGPKVSTLGPLYPKHDIEGLVIVPPSIGSTALGKLYGSVGGDGAPLNRKTPPFSGAIYEINRGTGALTPDYTLTKPPLTGYYEVSSLTIDPTTNVVWAWAKGDKKWPASPSGPITIDLSNHPSSVLTHLDATYPLYNPRIEGVAFSNDGKTLYGVERGKTGTLIYGYDVTTKALNVRCGLPDVAIKGESEALEIQPNGLLLLAIQSSVADLTFVAFDPKSCQIKALQVFPNIVYNDIESIEWPADECAGRSFLNPVPGAENISLDEKMVPPAVEAAIQSAIEKKKLGGDVYTEAGGGATVSVYIGDKVYVVHVVPKQAKSGARAGDRCDVVDATLTDDFNQLTFTDSCGNTEVWVLEPTAVSPVALLAALNQLGQGSVNEGNVSVTLADGTFVSGMLSVEVIPPVVAPGGALYIPPEGSPAQIVPAGIDANGDGIEDFKIIYPTGHEQILVITNVQ